MSAPPFICSNFSSRDRKLTWYAPSTRLGRWRRWGIWPRAPSWTLTTVKPRLNHCIFLPINLVFAWTKTLQSINGLNLKWRHFPKNIWIPIRCAQHAVWSIFEKLFIFGSKYSNCWLWNASMPKMHSRIWNISNSQQFVWISKITDRNSGNDRVS